MKIYQHTHWSPSTVLLTKISFEDSCHTLHVFSQWDSRVNDLSPSVRLISVVSVQPLPKLVNNEEQRYFVIEKSGIDDNELTGYVAPLDDGNRESRSHAVIM
jgi:hypothetical protein